jgi:hypothetical protein
MKSIVISVLLFLPSLCLAEGSVSFSTIKPILEQSPTLWKHLDKSFTFAGFGEGVRIGRHWPLLGGARVAPYSLLVVSKDNPKIKFTLVVNCVTRYYTDGGEQVSKEAADFIKKAAKTEEILLNVSLIPLDLEPDVLMDPLHPRG